MAKKEKRDKYKKLYNPSEPLYSNAAWVLQEGDVIKMNGKQYKVIQVYRSPIPGVAPKITLDELIPETDEQPNTEEIA